MTKNNKSKVGILYKIPDINNEGKYIYRVDCEEVDIGKVGNKIVDKDVNHVDYYMNLSKNEPELGLAGKFVEYDWYPRARVIYFGEKGIFKVYIDKCLDNEEDKKVFIEKFNLPIDKVIWNYDEQCQCKDCNKNIYRSYVNQTMDEAKLLFKINKNVK